MKAFLVSVVCLSVLTAQSVRAEDEEQARRQARRAAKAASADNSGARAARSVPAQQRQRFQQPAGGGGSYQAAPPRRISRYDANHSVDPSLYRARRNDARRYDAGNVADAAAQLPPRNFHNRQHNPAAPRDPNVQAQNFSGRRAGLTPEERAARRAARGNAQPVNRNSFAEAAARHHHEYHDHDWWRHNCSRIILISGGYYFWDAGYWYPAWGYDRSYSNYAWDGPIYAYNDLPPDQVISNVQAALQEDGYYEGYVDGELGPLTRIALARYQRDHGLIVTSAIDEPTLASLGLL